MGPVSSSDAQWIRSAVREFEGPLTLYAARILGDADRARDVVQDTFLRLCSQERFDLADHLPEWLFAVCRNRALDIRRKDGRLTHLDEEIAANSPGSASPPPHIVEQQESAAVALSLVGKLPENQQEVILLRFQHGLSYKQIAHVTGLSVTNIGFLIHTAIKTLRQKMSKERVP